MATECTSVAATWNGVTFGEVVDIKVVVGGDLPLARGSTWTLDGGSITLSCLSTANISMASYGKKATLSLAGGGLTFSTKCICERVELSGKVNDVARYAASFQITPE
jgi:hypothetical protein